MQWHYSWFNAYKFVSYEKKTIFANHKHAVKCALLVNVLKLKKITELYTLNSREIILLELFNLMDDTEQIDKLCGLSGYLGGRGILSSEESKNI